MNKTVLIEWARDLALSGIVGSPLLPDPLRWRALRIAGLDVRKSIIRSGGFYGGRSIKIGKGASINRNVFLDASQQISIGERVHIGMNSTILTASHAIGTAEERAGAAIQKPVTLEAGCWIGASCTILPGVVIGAGTIVAAGSIVVKDCDSDSLYAGVPAVKIRPLEKAFAPQS